jgi:monoamine oxidase
MSSTAGYTDVVIIGAGISGICAAKTLKKNNIPHMVLEASHRTGGRAFSEELSRNNWFDLGCSYLHNGKMNPFVSIAKAIKFPIDFQSGDIFNSQKTHYFLDGKKLNLSINNPLDKAQDNISKMIYKNSHDTAISENLDIEHPYFSVISHLLTNANAADPDLVSSIDYLASYYDGPDYSVPNGFGNLVKQWASDVLVKLNTKVNQINWDGPLIKVKTSKGLICTKKVIVTVSTGILANREIDIVPALPKEKQKAISNLPMGTLNKIGISFTKQIFSKKEQGWYVSWPDKKEMTDEEIGSFQVSGSGLQNAVVFTGGRFGEWLEERGSQTMRDYAISKIEDVFGTTYSKNIANTITTAWASEPLSKGAYSYARPKKSYSRNDLAKVVENKIYFAGEATETSHYGTAHGAYFSGARAANEIINDLRNNEE